MTENPLIGACLLKIHAECSCLDISGEVFDRLTMKSAILTIRRVVRRTSYSPFLVALPGFPWRSKR